MRDWTNEWLKKTRNEFQVGDYIYLHVRPEAECMDGFTLSIQASSGHYCTPCSNFAVDYEKVELCATKEPDLIAYSNGGIYDNVSVEIVNAVIEKHGGLKGL